MVSFVVSPKEGPAKPKKVAVKRYQRVNSPKNPAVSSVGAVTSPVGNPSLTLKLAGLKTMNRTRLLSNIRQGLDFKAVGFLERGLAATQKEIAQVLSIPVTTLNRRKREGRLRVDESDRAVRYAQLKDAALALMQGDDEAAIAWLRTPLDILGGETPLNHANTELGARDVEDLIGRLRHGVFS